MFATATLAYRRQGAADIRPYTLLSGWASVVPGITRASMRLEPNREGVVNPPLFAEDNLPDPWSNPLIVRIQRAFNPVAVVDLAYWNANRTSNTNGDWPSVAQSLARSATSMRTLMVFNDTFSGTAVDVTWEVRAGSATGAVASQGTQTVQVPLGGSSQLTCLLYTSPSPRD